MNSEGATYAGKYINYNFEIPLKINNPIGTEFDVAEFQLSQKKCHSKFGFAQW